MKKRKMERWECKHKKCVSLCVGIGMVWKCWWGFLEGRKGKEKWKEDIERIEWK